MSSDKTCKRKFISVNLQGLRCFFYSSLFEPKNFNCYLLAICVDIKECALKVFQFSLVQMVVTFKKSLHCTKGGGEGVGTGRGWGQGGMGTGRGWGQGGGALGCRHR